METKLRRQRSPFIGKHDVAMLTTFLKPEFEKTKKAFEKVKKQREAQNSVSPIIADEEYQKTEKKYFQLYKTLHDLTIIYEYFERFSIPYPWEKQP